MQPKQVKSNEVNMESKDIANQDHPTDPILKHTGKVEILVRNFVSQYRRPFSADTIASYTGITIKHLKPIIAEMIAEHQIKMASTNPEQIYVRVNRYMGIHELTHEHNRWNFDQDKAMILLEEVEATRHRNIRTIAQAIGKSRQWVYVYLEALASIGAIKKVDGYYKMISKDGIWAIGSNIKKGILKSIMKE